MEILLIVDDMETALENLAVLPLLDLPADTEYLLTSIRGTESNGRRQDPDLSRVKQALGEMGLNSNTIRMEEGDETSLLDFIHGGSFDLVVDLRERPRSSVLQLVQPSLPLAQSIDSTLLLAHPAPEKLERVLLCSGGEATSELTICEAGRLLRYTDAEIHVLHVMSQVPLDVAHPNEDLEVHAEAAMEQETREGRHLKRGEHWLRNAGITADIVPVIRHGLVVDEIMAELEEGLYDMVVVGAHRRTKSRIMNLLLEDITDKLITRVEVPLLIARIHPVEHIGLPGDGITPQA